MAAPRWREEGAGGGFDQVAGTGRVIRAVISRVPVPGVGGRSDRGLGTGSALAHQRVLKPGGGCEGGGEREARMPVADWTIQRQAFSGPLRGGGGRSLVPSSRYPGPMLSGSAVAMPTDPGPLRAGNRARSGECGIVRVRPQPPQLSVGRRIGCRVRVRLRRVGNGGGQRGPRLAPVCGRQDRLRFRGSCWGDRRRGRSGMGTFA
jgi:hypothetical protein